jgi:hypothetical protein
MSVETIKEPRNKYGGEVKERWRRGGGTMEEVLPYHSKTLRYITVVKAFFEINKV